MNRIDEVKQWIQTELLPNIVKSGKLKQNAFKPRVLNENDEESFEVVDIVIRPIGTDEAFMLTNCYRVKVVYVYEQKEDTCFFIAKRTPQLAAEDYEAINFDALFHNEIAAYTKIIPTLLQFAQPGIKELVFPKYYYSKLTDSEASIVLGDFEADGWKMAKSRFNLSLDHIIQAVQQVGAFHGLCYALKATERDNFDAIIEQVKESRYARPPPPHLEALSSASVQKLRNAVDKFSPHIPTHFLHKLQQLISSNFSYSKKRVEPIEPYATLCHGDFLRNNIAFKYSTEDPDRPTQAMMFDFQTLRYSSPMVDVCVLLLLSAGKDVRPMHFNAIFDAYHHKLTSIFASHTGMEVPAFLSKKKLLKEYVLYFPFALGIASYFLPTLHEPDGMSPEEMMAAATNVDLLVQDMLHRGGDKVDVELAALVNELYDLTIQENVDIFEGFN